MIFRQRIKSLIEDAGLLPVFYFFRRLFSWTNAVTFCHAFRFYLYNYWITNCPVYLLRLLYLRHILKIEIGTKSFVHMGCLFYENVKIGSNSVIGRECHLLGNITIKDNVSITAQTYIISSSHYKDSPDFEAYTKPVVIDDFAWIGARGMIMPGVHVGKGAVLGSASVATKDIPEYCVFVGSPAKEVGKRSKDLKYKLDYSPYFQ